MKNFHFHKNTWIYEKTEVLRYGMAVANCKFLILEWIRKIMWEEVSIERKKEILSIKFISKYSFFFIGFAAGLKPFWLGSSHSP